MEADLRRILKAVVLAMRHKLEGRCDKAGKWHPGDLENRLAGIGVRKDRKPIPVEELDRLSDEDRNVRKVVDAYVRLRAEAGVVRAEAVAEYVRESAFTWANRLIALRCMETRELIDGVILQKEAYGGRSMEHHRFVKQTPGLCTGEDEGLFTMLDKIFVEHSKKLPMLFDAGAPAIALRPSVPALKQCLAWLSGAESVRSHDPALDPVFVAPDALGWAYQYWNTEEKDRIFETVRTKKGAKIAGVDIIPATQLYTEDYMVKFLAQNSLGATWMGMHPGSKLCEQWEYYVRDADRAPLETKPVSEVTFLDPACGSGHFLIEAFDLYYAMYEEEGQLTEPDEICRSILENNLYGIDIDERAVQIAEATLWMKAAERAFDFAGEPTGLVAAVSSHLKGERWEQFLAGLQKEPLIIHVLGKFADSLAHIDQIGSLARPAEDLRAIIKEEHATWKRHVRERNDADFLFAEMRADALDGRFAAREINGDDFGEQLFHRAKALLDAFTRQAREQGEFQDQFMGREATGGFHLLDMLVRKYDVVVANPPYMGSRNMGPVLKRYVESNYKSGKRDLYAAFILRNAELTAEGGRVAMVTQQSWMFLRSFADLRAVDGCDQAGKRPVEKRGLLYETSMETLAHLGPAAFEEIGGEIVNTVMFVLSARPPDDSHRLTCFRLVSLGDPTQKSTALRDALVDSSDRIAFRPIQMDIAHIPKTPLIYWVSPTMLHELGGPQTVAAVGGVKQGLATGWNERFVRLHWECPNFRRWRKYAKGGGYQKWIGLETHRVDWEDSGRRIRSLADSAGKPRSAVRNDATYFAPGITYTLMAGGALGLRLLDESVYDVASMSIFPEHPSWDRFALMALLNTTIESYFARLITQELKFNTSYVTRLPILPDDLVPKFRLYGNHCCRLKRRIVSTRILEESFVPSTLTSHAESLSEASGIRAGAAVLHTIEAISQRQACDAFGLSQPDLDAMLGETGVPSGWYPSMVGYDDVPGTADELANSVELLEALDSRQRSVLPPCDLDDLKRSLQVAYESGPGARPEHNVDAPVDSNDADAGVPFAGARISIPAETFLEQLSQTFELHPISIYHLLKEGIEKAGWRCLPEERRLLQDRISVIVLQLLGHLWPTQVEAGEPLPPWSDLDGIIPLKTIAGDSPLIERVSQQLTADGIDADEFADVVCSPLDAWLNVEFFKHHTRQFKRRPIAWQLQTAGFTANTSPGFACLVYYQKIDTDALPKIRSQYVGPLRQRMETELRGITSVTVDARTDQQQERRVQLGEAIRELQAFDATLDAVVAFGFGPKSVLPKLRQFAVDDAMLSLKSRWLCRLRELIEETSLAAWLNAADGSGLHPELANWIQDALTHLSYSCASVGPKPPDQAETEADPTSQDLAALIIPCAELMTEGSLKLACTVWWKRFDEAVLTPLKEQVRQLKAEQKQCQATLKADPEPSPTNTRKLRARVKEIKAKVKGLNAEIAAKTAPARAIREQIEGWRSDEPRDWGDWLAEQPLFDEVASIDGTRAAPATVAEFIGQESAYIPDINDGVRVNIAPVQQAGLLAADVLAVKDVDRAIADRAEWRADERRWVREGKLTQCGWWPDDEPAAGAV